MINLDGNLNYTKEQSNVIIEGKKYKNLRPISMVWRPDRVICSYEVAGVHIKEEKFITKNDVLCDRITSDKSIQIFLRDIVLLILMLSQHSMGMHLVKVFLRLKLPWVRLKGISFMY